MTTRRLTRNRLYQLGLLIGFIALVSAFGYLNPVQARSRWIDVTITRVEENTYDGTGISDGKRQGKTIHYRLDTIGYRNVRIRVQVWVYTARGSIVTCTLRPFCQPGKTLGSWSYVIPRYDENTMFSTVFIPYTAFPHTPESLSMIVYAWATTDENSTKVRGNSLNFDWRPIP